jgi:streptogramin lyase
MSDKALRELAETTVQNPVAARAPIDQLRARNRRRQRRRVATLSATLVVVIAGVGGAIWLRAGDRSTVRVETKASSPTTPNVPSTNSTDEPLPNAVEPAERVQSDVPNPVAFAVRGGTVWVLTSTDVPCECSQLHALDADTMHERAKVRVREAAIGVATSEDGVWVLSQRADGSPYAVTLVDPSNLRVRRVVELPQRAYGFTNPGAHIAATHGSAWIGVDSTLDRVDASTGEVTQIPLTIAPYRMAVDDTSIWIANYASPEVLRVDAASGEVLQTISVDPAALLWSVAANDHAAWVVANYAGPGDTEPTAHLVRIDSGSYELTRFALPAIGVAASDGSVWIHTESGYAGQVDPNSGAIVQSFRIMSDTPVGNPSGGPTLALDSGSIYTGTERVRPPQAPASTTTTGPEVAPSSAPRCTGAGTTRLEVRLAQAGSNVLGVAKLTSEVGTCTVSGTPGIHFEESSTTVVDELTRQPVASDQLITLQPGQSASANFVWSNWCMSDRQITRVTLTLYPDGGNGSFIAAPVDNVTPSCSDVNLTSSVTIAPYFKDT